MHDDDLNGQTELADADAPDDEEALPGDVTSVEPDLIKSAFEAVRLMLVKRNVSAHRADEVCQEAFKAWFEKRRPWRPAKVPDFRVHMMNVARSKLKHDYARSTTRRSNEKAAGKEEVVLSDERSAWPEAGRAEEQAMEARRSLMARRAKALRKHFAKDATAMKVLHLAARGIIAPADQAVRLGIEHDEIQTIYDAHDRIRRYKATLYEEIPDDDAEVK